MFGSAIEHQSVVSYRFDGESRIPFYCADFPQAQIYTALQDFFGNFTPANGSRFNKVNAKYIEGDTPDCGKSASPDQSEWDLNLDYTPPYRSLAGLNLRLRFGWVDQDDTCGIRDGVDIADVRFILNYEFDF